MKPLLGFLLVFDVGSVPIAVIHRGDYSGYSLMCCKHGANNCTDSTGESYTPLSFLIFFLPNITVPHKQPRQLNVSDLHRNGHTDGDILQSLLNKMGLQTFRHTIEQLSVTKQGGVTGAARGGGIGHRSVNQRSRRLPDRSDAFVAALAKKDLATVRKLLA